MTPTPAPLPALPEPDYIAFYADKIKQPMTLDQLRAEVRRLSEAGAPSPELLLAHAMLLLDAAPVAQQAAPIPTPAQVERHTLLARECAPDCQVILVSSIKRLQAAAHAQQPAPVALTDAQIDAAIEAWFKNDIVAGPRPFAKRMRAAFAAAGIPAPTTDTGEK